MKKNIYLYGLLLQQNMNLHTLSEKSGVAYATVYNLFSGKKRVEDCASGSLKKIAETLDIRMDDLFRLLDLETEKTTEKEFPDFQVLWGDELVADVRVGDKEVWVERYTTHPAKQIFSSEHTSRLDFGKVIASRCWDPKRKDIDVLMERLGLTEYNTFEICKRTHGLMAQDRIWFRFKGEHLNYQEARNLMNAF